MTSSKQEKRTILFRGVIFAISLIVSWGILLFGSLQLSSILIRGEMLGEQVMLYIETICAIGLCLIFMSLMGFTKQFFLGTKSVSLFTKRLLVFLACFSVIVLLFEESLPSLLTLAVLSSYSIAYLIFVPSLITHGLFCVLALRIGSRVSDHLIAPSDASEFEDSALVLRGRAKITLKNFSIYSAICFGCWLMIPQLLGISSVPFPTLTNPRMLFGFDNFEVSIWIVAFVLWLVCIPLFFRRSSSLKLFFSIILIVPIPAAFYVVSSCFVSGTELCRLSNPSVFNIIDGFLFLYLTGIASNALLFPSLVGLLLAHHWARQSDWTFTAVNNSRDLLTKG